MGAMRELAARQPAPRHERGEAAVRGAGVAATRISSSSSSPTSDIHARLPSARRLQEPFSHVHFSIMRPLSYPLYSRSSTPENHAVNLPATRPR